MKRIVISLVALGTLATGCCGPRMNFTGQPQPATFATVYTDPPRTIAITRVNGEDTRIWCAGYPFSVMVPGGTCSLELWAETAPGVPGRGAYKATPTFPVQNGKRYRVALEPPIDSTNRFDCAVRDTDSNEVIFRTPADFIAAPPPPPPVPHPPPYPVPPPHPGPRHGPRPGPPRP